MKRRFGWQTGGSTLNVEKKIEIKGVFPPILTIIIIVGLVYVLFASSLFKINKIEVIGNEFVDTALIEKIVVEQYEQTRFWFLRQDNILVFNDAEVIRSIEHPRIQDVYIVKNLPNTLTVGISEKTATAIWHQQGRWFELDSDGQVISETGGPSRNSIILFSSTRVDPSNAGTTVTDKATIEAIKAIEANFPRSLGFTINRYDVSEIGDFTITATTSEDWGLRFSMQLPLSDQMSKLKKFVIDKNQDNETWRDQLSYIDLRFGISRIYYQ